MKILSHASIHVYARAVERHVDVIPFAVYFDLVPRVRPARIFAFNPNAPHSFYAAQKIKRLAYTVAHGELFLKNAGKIERIVRA